MNLNLIIKLLLVVTFTTYSNAEVLDEKDYFNAICTSKDSSGFNWDKSKWHSVKFERNKYIVKKIKIEDLKSPADLFTNKSGMCATQKQNQPFASFISPIIVEDGPHAGKTTVGCYNIRKYGTDHDNLQSKMCFEFWKKNNTGKYNLVRVTCSDENFNFNPNGWFHHSSIHDDVEDYPLNDYKDSLMVEYGKCSTL